MPVLALELRSARALCGELQVQLQSTADALQGAQQQLEGAAADARQLRDQAESLQQRVEGMESAAAAGQAELTAARQAVEQLEGEKQQLLTQLAAAAAVKESAANKVAGPRDACMQQRCSCVSVPEHSCACWRCDGTDRLLTLRMHAPCCWAAAVPAALHRCQAEFSSQQLSTVTEQLDLVIRERAAMSAELAAAAGAAAEAEAQLASARQQLAEKEAGLAEAAEQVRCFRCVLRACVCTCLCGCVARPACKLLVLAN